MSDTKPKVALKVSKLMLADPMIASKIPPWIFTRPAMWQEGLRGISHFNPSELVYTDLPHSPADVSRSLPVRSSGDCSQAVAFGFRPFLAETGFGTIWAAGFRPRPIFFASAEREAE